MHEFENFMRKLAADSRLGRLLSPDVSTQTPEVVVLDLVMRLADALEGNAPNPAIELLDRMQQPRRVSL